MDANIIDLSLSEGFSAKICLFGATVTSWINNGQEQLFLSSLSKMDGTKAVRGGIPIVFPNFGPWDSGPQHGFARISWWELAGTDKGDASYAKAIFHLKENDYTLSMWKHKFELDYEVEIQRDTLKTTLTIKNSGNDVFDFTTLLHTYLRVPDIQECAISGFHGCSYIDKVKKEDGQVESRYDVKISENVDSAYHGTKEHIVKCHGTEVKVTKANFPDTVLWNPWATKAKEMSDFDDDGYKRMVCVEPGYVSERKVLQPGLTFTCSQTLAVN